MIRFLRYAAFRSLYVLLALGVYAVSAVPFALGVALAVTPDGRRAVTVAVASTLEPGQDILRQAEASATLIDHALCATPGQ